MRGSLQFWLAGALAACVCALVGAPAAAQGSYSPYDESPAAALARYVRTLASDPTDFQSLIGAGKAALELGDAQAAAGFFARADDAQRVINEAFGQCLADEEDIIIQILDQQNRPRTVFGCAHGYNKMISERK